MDQISKDFVRTCWISHLINKWHIVLPYWMKSKEEWRQPLYKLHTCIELHWEQFVVRSKTLSKYWPLMDYCGNCTGAFHNFFAPLIKKDLGQTMMTSLHTFNTWRGLISCFSELVWKTVLLYVFTVVPGQKNNCKQALSSSYQAELIRYSFKTFLEKMLLQWCKLKKKRSVSQKPEPDDGHRPWS